MKELSIKIVISTGFMAICICLFIIGSNQNRIEIKKIQEKFIKLPQSQAIKSRITEKNILKKLRYSTDEVYVTLDDYLYFRIYCELNHHYTRSGINEILDQGDSLIKQGGNDTIFVKKNYGNFRSYGFRLKSKDSKSFYH